ncbi:hypothetical protein L7F22_005408 [Adiantum nelumboides]|nr:hypothetical protein [Adiantum nelumboides]
MLLVAEKELLPNSLSNKRLAQLVINVAEVAMINCMESEILAHVLNTSNGAVLPKSFCCREDLATVSEKLTLAASRHGKDAIIVCARNGVELKPQNERQVLLFVCQDQLHVVYSGVTATVAEVKPEDEQRGKILPKDKGKTKVGDVDAMPIKRARQEEVVMSETRERRKSKETGGEQEQEEIKAKVEDHYQRLCTCLHAVHLEKVNEGLATLESLGGQLNVDKCHIAESQATLLGHVVSSSGIEANTSKVQALVGLPSPKSAKELVSFIQKRTRLPDHPEFLTLQSKVESLQAQLQTEREMTDESMTQLMQKVTELEREKGKALLDAKHAREKIRALEEVLHDDHVWKDVNYDVDESIRLEDPENFELPFELYCDIMDEERTSHLERIAIMDDCVKSMREGIDKYKQIVLGNQVRSKSKQLHENLVDMLKFNSDYNRISKMTKQTTKWAVDGSSFSSTLDTGLELDVRGTSKRGCQSRCGHCSAGRHTIKMCPSRKKMVVKSIKAKKHLSSTPQWSTELKQVRQNYFQQEKFDNGSLGFNGIVRSQRRGEVHPIQEKVLDIYMVEIADWGDPDMSTAIVPYCHLSPVNSVNVKEEEKQEAEHLINKHSLLENVVYKEEKHPVIRAKSRSQSSFVVMKENLTVQWEVSEDLDLEIHQADYKRYLISLIECLSDDEGEESLLGSEDSGQVSMSDSKLEIDCIALDDEEEIDEGVLLGLPRGLYRMLLPRDQGIVLYRQAQPYGNLQPVLPFGLANAPAYFRHIFQ